MERLSNLDFQKVWFMHYNHCVYYVFDFLEPELGQRLIAKIDVGLHSSSGDLNSTDLRFLSAAGENDSNAFSRFQLGWHIAILISHQSTKQDLLFYHELLATTVILSD
jgi:hypothetical protein